MFDRSPETVRLSVDVHEHLIEVPAPMPKSAHPADLLAFDVDCEQRTKPVHQNRTVSWQISIPRSNSRSSAFRKDKGKLTYIITTNRMTSDEELKRLNGLSGLQRLGIEPPHPHRLNSHTCS